MSAKQSEITNSESTELDQLRITKRRLSFKLSSLNQQRVGLGQQQQETLSEMQELDKKITKLLNDLDRPKISDHALIRYLERIKGIDISAIREEMLPEDVCTNVRKLKTGKFPIGSCTLVARDMVVTTIMLHKTPKGQNKKRAKNVKTDTSN